MRVLGEPGLNPWPTLRATGWKTDPGTLTPTLSRGEREYQRFAAVLFPGHTERSVPARARSVSVRA